MPGAKAQPSVPGGRQSGAVRLPAQRQLRRLGEAHSPAQGPTGPGPGPRRPHGRAHWAEACFTARGCCVTLLGVPGTAYYILKTESAPKDY